MVRGEEDVSHQAALTLSALMAADVTSATLPFRDRVVMERTSADPLCLGNPFLAGAIIESFRNEAWPEAADPRSTALGALRLLALAAEKHA